MPEFDENAIQSLLGRKLDLSVDPVRPLIEGKSVMVTGAGGSIGSALVMQLIALKPKTLVLYEACEYNLYKIEQTARPEATKAGSRLIPVLGNLSSSDQLQRLLRTFEVSAVYHAAAYKHVPMVERNPVAGIVNNVFGTSELAIACSRAGVPNFVCVSTDKAVRPTNVMGCTKRLAEYAVMAVNTQYKVVRFGNVLGSSGSVIPLFMSQMGNLQPMTVTDPEVTRYFMSIDEAVRLILLSTLVTEGRVCVLDMGVQVKIDELADRLAKMQGYDTYPKQYIGLRPGEKLYEELTLGENLHPTATKHIQVAKEAVQSVAWVETVLVVLDQLCRQRDLGGIRAYLSKIVPGYEPSCGIVDDLWLEEHVFQFHTKLDDCFAPASQYHY